MFDLDILELVREEKIRILEANIGKIEQPEIPITHSFAPGLYIREVHIPAGSAVIGHCHKLAHLNIMIAGRCDLQNPDGSYIDCIAPFMYTAQPGRKILYVHEDTVWLNIFATNETDISKLDEMFVDKTEEYEEGVKASSIKLICHEQANLDYNNLQGVGYGKSLATDAVPLPYGSYKIQVDESLIDGKGLFASGNIFENEIIAPARISGKSTIAERYINHSGTPNAMLKKIDNDDLLLIALRDIHGAKGGLIGEEITIDYREVA